jgi:hypothetical protein
MTRTTLDKITDREQQLLDAAAQIQTQIEALRARLGELEAERAELAIARKVILALASDEPVPATHPGLPDNPAYQHILTVLTEAETPLRCKDLCHALDTGTEPARIEGMRAKLKRLVATGLVTEDTPGMFAIPRPRTGIRLGSRTAAPGQAGY